MTVHLNPNHHQKKHMRRLEDVVMAIGLDRFIRPLERFMKDRSVNGC